MTFDQDGFAKEDFSVKVYVVDDAGELIGSVDTVISAGTGLPARAYLDAPPNAGQGKAIVRKDGGWVVLEDHRGEKVYSTTDRSGFTIDYIGAIKEGFTRVAPASAYDSWNGSVWVTDTAAQHAADVATVELYAQQLVDRAMQSISVIQLKLQVGRTLTEEETTKLNGVLDYIDSVNSVDTATAPDITWPEQPA